MDAARFFFNLREANSRMDFDLDLAVEQSASNPVYYVQYAHARICSLFRNLEAEGLIPQDCTGEELALLAAPEEKELIRHLAAYPREIVAAARDYDPARMTRYCLDLAALFHKFYNACRVEGEEESLLQARLSLCAAVRYAEKRLDPAEDRRAGIHVIPAPVQVRRLPAFLCPKLRQDSPCFVCHEYERMMVERWRLGYSLRYFWTAPPHRNTKRRACPPGSFRPDGPWSTGPAADLVRRYAASRCDVLYAPHLRFGALVLPGDVSPGAVRRQPAFVMPNPRGGGKGE